MIMKKFISMIIVLSVITSVCFSEVYTVNAEEVLQSAESAEIDYNRSIQLQVSGNKIVEYGTDNMVVLRGVNIPSMGWGMAEHLYESMTQVYDSWNANLVRFPITPKYWFNGSDTMTADAYKQYVDDMVKGAQARGKYIILDCHTYVMPIQETLDLWKEVAPRYANNSAVLFGLLNEPHDIKPTGVDAQRSAWDVWRNGGQVTISNEEVTGIGHQQLLEEIRALGANNICIAGGLNWAFDISGLANGYDDLENGYRLEDTANGMGVMYDSHAYPVKGAKSSWDKVIGPVRRVAPVLIGEWGWDSGDKAISGGDCTSDIWMNQIMNWMDDTYNEYDGIPVNWAGWNLHMSSSPRMLIDWSFKTTAYNGSYIKERLKSYASTIKPADGMYTNTFDPDTFRSHTGKSGKSSVTVSEENKNVVVYHQPTTWNATLNFPIEWDLNGIQSLELDVSCDIEEKVNIGLYGADMEAWTKEISVDNNVKTVKLYVNELSREGNANTDGKLDGAVTGIYFGGVSDEKGNITVDNIKITKLAKPVLFAQDCPYVNEGQEINIDIDTTKFASEKTVAGPAATSYFKIADEPIADADGNDTVAKLISYNRTDGAWGGSAQFNLETVPSSDVRYFSVRLKGSGVEQKAEISLGGVASFSTILAADDTDWHQYIVRIDDLTDYPEDIKYVRFTSGTKTETYFYADDFIFSAQKPERKVPDPEKIFVYDFATYNKNTAKYEAKLQTKAGGDGDLVNLEKVDGGFDSDTQALEIKYSRGSGDVAQALMVYSSSDFFKGNAGDDVRTEGRATLKADMSYMTDLVFYGVSTSGKDEKINVAVIDAANSMSTYTTQKIFTLTSDWKQFRVPFDEFNVLDGGGPLDCSRVRGFVFSSAETNTTGSFMIDNVTHTNIESLDVTLPTPTPTPTVTPEPTITPEPTVTPTPTPTDTPVYDGDWRVITTAEEAIALTATDTAVRLGADIDVATGIIKTKCATTFDLNGYKLSGSAGGVIDTSYNITFMDSSENGTGAVVNTSTGTSSYAVKAARDIVINGGNFSGGQGFLASTREDGHTLVINGGSFTATNGNGYGLNISKYDVTINNAIVTHPTASGGGAIKLAGGGEAVIHNGNFSSQAVVINVADTNLTINGGEFANSMKSKGVLYATSTGNLTVNGGTFQNNSSNNPVVLATYKSASGEIKLTEGTYTGNISVATESTATIEISGGTYSVDPSVYVAKNCVVETQADGRYTVNSDEVSDKYLISTPVFDESKITVDVTLPDVLNNSATMYVVAYNTDGEMIKLYLCTQIEASNQFDTVKDIASVKAFIWDANMVPLTK